MKVKRTYNLAPEVVATVKSLVEERHVAPTQDALVEAAIRQYGRQLQDAEDTRRWSQAAADPEFQAEMAELWAEFADEDAAAWEV